MRDSSADIASNTINDNGGDGVDVAENSFVQLGEDSGASIYESTNTTTSTNTGVGIRCTSGGVADGLQGTLNGVAGVKDFAGAGCMIVFFRFQSRLSVLEDRPAGVSAPELVRSKMPFEALPAMLLLSISA